MQDCFDSWQTQLEIKMQGNTNFENIFKTEVYIMLDTVVCRMAAGEKKIK